MCLSSETRIDNHKKIGIEVVLKTCPSTNGIISFKSCDLWEVSLSGQAVHVKTQKDFEREFFSGTDSYSHSYRQTDTVTVAVIVIVTVRATKFYDRRSVRKKSS
jgi:hypothetical protein